MNKLNVFPVGVLSIKIKIGDREYPMRVEASEEEKVRMAGRIINDNLKKYKDLFGIHDKQDLLAMVAFDAVVDKLRSDADNISQSEIIFSKISHLDDIISKNLSED